MKAETMVINICGHFKRKLQNLAGNRSAKWRQSKLARDRRQCTSRTPPPRGTVYTFSFLHVILVVRTFKLHQKHWIWNGSITYDLVKNPLRREPRYNAVFDIKIFPPSFRLIVRFGCIIDQRSLTCAVDHHREES